LVEDLSRRHDASYLCPLGLRLARFSGRVSEKNYAATCNCASYVLGLR
jgi:hypothetical protein